MYGACLGGIGWILGESVEPGGGGVARPRGEEFGQGTREGGHPVGEAVPESGAEASCGIGEQFGAGAVPGVVTALLRHLVAPVEQGHTGGACRVENGVVVEYAR